jgi:hypothetical protein
MYIAIVNSLKSIVAIYAAFMETIPEMTQDSSIRYVWCYHRRCST